MNITVNSYERNQVARKKCIDRYGTTCAVCGFSFKDKYGTIAEDFIHIHHLKPLYTINKEYEINPITDLRPVCPNCHAVIHLRDPVYSIEELKELIDEGIRT